MVQLQRRRDRTSASCSVSSRMRASTELPGAACGAPGRTGIRKAAATPGWQARLWRANTRAAIPKVDALRGGHPVHEQYLALAYLWFCGSRSRDAVEHA